MPESVRKNAHQRDRERELYLLNGILKVKVSDTDIPGRAGRVWHFWLETKNENKWCRGNDIICTNNEEEIAGQVPNLRPCIALGQVCVVGNAHNN